MFCVDMGRLSLARERGGLGSAPGSKSFREVGECNSKPITVILSPSREEGEMLGPRVVRIRKLWKITKHRAQSANTSRGVGQSSPRRGPLMRKEDVSTLAKIFPRFPASPRLLSCK